MTDYESPAAARYLDLLKGCLTRMLFPDLSWDWDLANKRPFDPDLRREGQDWPTEAETMVGMPVTGEMPKKQRRRRVFRSDRHGERVRPVGGPRAHLAFDPDS